MKICSKCSVEKDITFFRVGHNICIECQKEYKKIWRQSDKAKKAAKKYESCEFRKKYMKEYFQSEKYKKHCESSEANKKKKISDAKYHTSNKAIENRKKRSFNYISTLSDTYIIARLKNKGFSKESITEHTELIEVQKLIIKTKRLCKTSQN